MAWTTPKTWAVGDPATAADLNTYVRDNVAFLYGTRIQANRISVTYTTGGYNLVWANGFPGAFDALTLSIEGTTDYTWALSSVSVYSAIILIYSGGTEIPNGTVVVVDYVVAGH
jgi:hypothetical protein